MLCFANWFRGFQLVLLANFAVSYDFCTNDKEERLCGIGRRHIVCYPESVPMGGNFVIQAPNTYKLLRTILNNLNIFRSKVASGDFPNLPSAAAMRELNWNNELEYIAVNHINRCSTAEDECHKSFNFPNAGELRATFGSSEMPNITATLAQVLKGIAKQVDSLSDPAQITKGYSAEDEKMAHDFSLIVNDQISKVGCAIGYCTDCEASAGGEKHAHCFYLTCLFDTQSVEKCGVYIAASDKAGESCDIYGTKPSTKYKGLCNNNGKTFPHRCIVPEEPTEPEEAVYRPKKGYTTTTTKSTPRPTDASGLPVPLPRMKDWPKIATPDSAIEDLSTCKSFPETSDDKCGPTKRTLSCPNDRVLVRENLPYIEPDKYGVCKLDQAKLCWKNPAFPQMMCDNTFERLGDPIHVHRFDDYAKKMIVDFHNRKRNDIAGGTVCNNVEPNPQNYPQASRMREIVWDEELEYMCEMHGRKCQFKHDNCHNTKNFRSMGQNLGFAGQKLEWYVGSCLYNLENAMINWYNEKDKVTYTSPKDFIENYNAYKATERNTGHFAQMMMDSVTKIGCTIVICNNLQFRLHPISNTSAAGVFTCCHYDWAVLHAGAIYKPGPPTSECKSTFDAEVSTKYPNLCAPEPHGKLYWWVNNTEWSRMDEVAKPF